MAKNKNRQRAATPPAVNVAEKIPLVSVIIPMYNSAKFIPQTLESLLYQTMKDFEVVVIDDCSTDNSVEVVESFAERFGGRLHVVKLPKNTGTPGLPRNVGIQFARGKYISFLDSDDLYTKTALEELSTLAEDYQADVVRTNSWFTLWENKEKYTDDPIFTDMNELTNPANCIIKSEWNPKLVNKPILESEDIAERVKSFINWNTFWTSVLSFYRRDFLVTNQNFFPDMLKSEDASFVLNCFINAKRFLRVPNIVYINRPRIGSVSRVDGKNFNIDKYFHNIISSLKDGFNELERAMDQNIFFSNHRDYRYAVLEFFFNKTFAFELPMQNIYAQVPAFKLHDFAKKEFNPEDAALSAYLFNTVNVYRLQLMRLQRENTQLKKSLAQK